MSVFTDEVLSILTSAVPAGSTASVEMLVCLVPFSTARSSPLRTMRCELLTESSEISFVGAAKIQSPSATAPVRAMLGLVSTVPPASSVGALSALVAAAMRTIMVTNCARVSLFDGDSLAAEVPFTTPWLIRAAAACFCSVVMEEVSVKLLSSSAAVSARSYANARAISTKASARVAAVSKLRLSFAVIRPRWMALPRSSLYHGGLLAGSQTGYTVGLALRQAHG